MEADRQAVTTPRGDTAALAHRALSSSLSHTVWAAKVIMGSATLLPSKWIAALLSGLFMPL